MERLPRSAHPTMGKMTSGEIERHHPEIHGLTRLASIYTMEAQGEVDEVRETQPVNPLVKC